MSRGSLMRVVVAFDVSDDKKRRELVTVLQGVSQRVQKSVFEARGLKPAEYLRLRSKAERIVDPSSDSLRYYRLCGACVGRIEHFGVGPGVLEGDEPFRIIG